MPGMVTRDEVLSLEALDGRAFDERFLELMIRHHEGAVTMAKEARGQAADPRVRLFADQVRHPQSGQIRRMEAIRRSLEDNR